MTAGTLFNVLKNGGGRVEYFMTAGGAPWILSTSQSAATAVTADTTFRRLVLGSGTTDIGVYAADSVPIIPCLANVGRTSASVDLKRGLEVSPLTVEISDIDPGIDWSQWITSSVFFGIPLISNVFSQDADSSIKYGRIAEKVNDDDTSWDIFDEYGFGDWVTANPNSLVWLGTECLATDSVGAGTIADTIKFYQADRGVLRTKACNHYTDAYGASGSIISSAPIGSIADRFCYVWAVPFANDFSEYGDPVLIHHGRCSQDVDTRDGVTTLKIMSWVDSALSAEIKMQSAEYNLKRYVLMRGAEPTDLSSATDAELNGYQAAHLVILESAVGSTTWYQRNIWLCDQNSEVQFDTPDDVYTALDKELRACSSVAASSQNTSQISGDGVGDNSYVECTHDYYIKDGIIYVDLGISDIGHVKIGGQLAPILGLGAAFDGATSEGSEFIPNIAHLMELSTGNINPWSRPRFVRAVGTSASAASFFMPAPGGDIAGIGSWWIKKTWNPSPYFYQWYDAPSANNTYYQNSSHTEKCEAFPFPQISSGARRLYFDAEDDLSEFSTASPWVMGNSVVKNAYWGEGDIEAVAKFGVSGTGTDGDYNYATVDTTYGFDYGPSLESAQQIGGTPVFVARGGLFHLSGLAQYLGEDTEVKDLWTISQASTVRTSDFHEIIRGVFGDPNGVAFSDRATLDYLPDAVTDGDFVSTIDFDDLEDKMSRFAPGQRYQVTKGQNLGTIKQIFFAELRAHGIVPVWSMDTTTTPNQFRIKFRQINDYSIPDAKRNGRTIAQTDRVTDRITQRGGTQPRYSDVKYQASWDGEEYQLELSAQSEQARAALNGRTSTLDLESKISQIPGGSQLANDKATRDALWRHFAQRVLLPSALPVIAVSAKLAISKALSLSAGNGCSVTDDQIRNPYTGGYGVSEAAGWVTSLSIDWMDGSVGAEYAVIAGAGSYPIAPALYLDAGDAERTVAGASGTVSIRNSLTNIFSGSGARTDLSWFDCLDWDKLTNTYTAGSCSCGDYAIKALEYDDETFSPVAGTIGSVDAAANTAELSINTTSFAWAPEILGGDTGSNPSGGYQKIAAASSSSTSCYLIASYPSGKIYQLDSNGTVSGIQVKEGDGTPSALYMGFGIAMYGGDVLIGAQTGALKYVYSVDPDTGYYTDLGRPGNTPNVLAVDGSVVYSLSGADGSVKKYASSSWSSIGTITGNGYAMIVDSSGDLWAINGSDLYKYTGPSTWTAQSIGTGGYQLVDFGGEIWIGSNAAGKNVYSWDGSTLTDRGAPGTGTIYGLTTDGTSVYAIEDGGDLFEYDTGTTWTTVASLSSTNNTAVRGATVFNGGKPAWTSAPSTRRGVFYNGDVNENPIIVKYSSFDDANLQDCQRDWAYYADGDNELVDSDAVVYPGRRIT